MVSFFLRNRLPNSLAFSGYFRARAGGIPLSGRGVFLWL